MVASNQKERTAAVLADLYMGRADAQRSGDTATVGELDARIKVLEQQMGHVCNCGTRMKLIRAMLDAGRGRDVGALRSAVSAFKDTIGADVARAVKRKPPKSGPSAAQD